MYDGALPSGLWRLPVPGGARFAAAVFLGVLLSGVGAFAAAGDLATTDALLGPREMNAVLHLIRARISPEETPPMRVVPGMLDAVSETSVIVSVYLDGPVGVPRVVTRTTLREAAGEAAEGLRLFYSRLPEGDGILKRARVQVDVVGGRRPIRARNHMLLAQELRMGLDGLVCVGGGRETYFAPTAVMRSWRKVDLVTALYLSQESAAPPEGLRIKRFRSVSFVEETPGGKALALYRGNVLVGDPYPNAMLRAVSRTGLWFLKTQQDDGRFLKTYHPADQKTEGTYDIEEHMRATLALTLLRRLFGDKPFSKACDDALRVAKAALREGGEGRLAFAYVDDTEDPITASALLLTCLSSDALAELDPTADGLMRQLGEFLCVMTASDGHMYSSVANALNKRPHHMSQGGPYAEALIALTLLQRTSPSERVRRAAHAIGELLAGGPDALPRVKTEPQSWPRMVEALVQYHSLTRTERYGTAALDLARRLSAFQKGPDSNYADSEGGYAERGLPPDSLFTAMATSAMASAYEVGRMMRREDVTIPVRIDKGAVFLMNMQYRDENSFFLRQQERVLGAVRSSPVDLSLRLASTAEAVRALSSAAAIATETASPDAR